MIINISNGELINSKKIYIHDDVFEELCFHRMKKKLHLSIYNESKKKRRSIVFLNVIGFEMTSCDFWGSSPHILDFEYVEPKDHTLIPKLFDKNDSNFSRYLPNDLEKYIETTITLTSGDQLIVACENIMI